MTKALQGAIDKWKEICFNDGPDEGVKNCPLCHLYFYTRGGISCIGCPVYEKTEERYCGDTPYEKFSIEMENCSRLSEIEDIERRIKAHKHALDMLQFLIDLKEEYEK